MEDLAKLLALIEATPAKTAAVPPQQRQLRFSLCMGKGWIQGDEGRVELCCALYNAREQIAELIRRSASS